MLVIATGMPPISIEKDFFVNYYHLNLGRSDFFCNFVAQIV